jgi:fructose-1,6-bisphosphatase II / sedoheptulose-1,7-bisphosphatase
VRQKPAQFAGRDRHGPKAAACCNAPDSYMDKIAIGPGYPDGVVRPGRDPADNIKALAKAKGVPSRARSRPACLTARATRTDRRGAPAGAGHPPDHRWRRGRRHPYHRSGRHRHRHLHGCRRRAGRRAWRRQRCAALAARCRAGWCSTSPTTATRARKMGVKDPDAKFSLTEMASGDVMLPPPA